MEGTSHGEETAEANAEKQRGQVDCSSNSLCSRRKGGREDFAE